MKNLKALLALMLVFALVLTACSQGGTTETAEPAETTETTESAEAGEETTETGALKGDITVQAETAWLDYYQKAADKIMEANPDANITIMEVGSFDHLDTLDATDALNEDVADVFAIPADRLYGLNDALVLNPIDAERLASEVGGFDDFTAGLGVQFNIDGEYLAFPYNIETLITYTNKANAEAAGIDINNPIELVGAPSEATVLLPVFDAWYGVAASNAAGIELLGKDDNGGFFSDLTKPYAELNADQQGAINAIFEYWKAHNDAGTPLFDADAGWAYVDEQFKTGGNGVIRLGGPWEQETMNELAGDDLVIGAIDKITMNGKPLSHWKGGWGLAINSRNEENPDNIELAYAMIKELVAPANAVELFKATGKILENATVDTYMDSDLTDVQKEIIEATYVSYADAPGRPLFSEWGSVWDTWKNALLSWNTVKPATVEDAYAELNASFNAMMANF